MSETIYIVVRTDDNLGLHYTKLIAAYRSRESAERRVAQLEQRGLDSYVVEELPLDEDAPYARYQDIGEGKA